MLRFVYRSIAWAVPKLPAFYRTQILAELAAKSRARTIACDGELGVFHGLPHDVGVFQEYRETGDYSPHIHAVLGALLPRGGTLLDVGANIGMVSVPIAKRYGVVCHAFEPDPTNHALLVRNVAENGARERVRTYPVALAAEDGEMELEISKDSPGDNRLRAGGPSPGLFGEQDRVTVKVPVRRMDDVLTGEQLSGPVVMKIDVQGAEVKVFGGARHTLDRVDFVVAEFWPYGLRRLGDAPEAFFETMKRFPLAGIIDEAHPGVPELRPTGAVIDEMLARVPVDGSAMLGDLDVVLARSSPAAP